MKTERKLFGAVLVISVVITGVLLGLVGLMKQETQQVLLPTPIPIVQGGETTIQGTVIENYLGCHVDGLCYLTLQTTEEKELRVVYHYGEFPRCLNNKAVLQGELLKEGEEVRIFGKAIGDSEVSTCDSFDYYIEKIGESIDTADWQTYTNEEFGFEVDYPSEFQLIKQDKDFISLSQQGFSRIEINSMSKEQASEILFTINKMFRMGREGEAGLSYLTKKGVVVLGKDATQFFYVTDGRTGDISIETYIKLSNSSIISFRMIDLTGKALRGLMSQSVEELHNQILSTFRFIDSPDIERVELDRKQIWFSDVLQGEVFLSSIDAVIDSTHPEELSCLYPQPEKKRYRGNFLLSFQNHILPLGDLEFVEDTQYNGDLLIKRFDPINTQDFIVLTQYGSCNGNSKSIIGYSFKDSKLKIFPFVREEIGSSEWLFGSVAYVSGEIVNRFYDNSDGKSHNVFYTWDQPSETFRFIREETQNL